VSAERQAPVDPFLFTGRHLERAKPVVDHGSTSAREEILRRIRAATTDVPREETAASFDVPRDYARGRDLPGLVELFVERVEDYRALVTRVGSEAELPGVIDAALGDRRRIVIGAWFEQSWLPAGVEVVDDDPPLTPDELDTVQAVVTTAAVGIAVTGTVVLDHFVGQGRRALSLVPDLHVCIVRTSQVVDDLPAAVTRLQPSVAEHRALTWISGGSATSDIELDRVEGVHGPRTLHVLLLEDSA